MALLKYHYFIENTQKTTQNILKKYKKVINYTCDDVFERISAIFKERW